MSDVQNQAELDSTIVPGSEDQEPEVKHEGFIRLDKHQKDVNNQHKKFQDERRGREASESKLAAAQKELDELRSINTDLTIPDVPDQYADDYAEQIAARDEKIRQNADHQAEEKRLAADKESSDKELADKIAKEDAAQVAVFDSNMVALGLTPADVKASADKIVAAGISDGLSDFILEDPDGPLLVQYLDANPVDLDEMNKMSSLALFNHINATVRAKARLLKPKTSDAPDPPIVLTGGGVPELKEGWEKGVKYE